MNTKDNGADVLEKIYDEVRYPGSAHQVTHPSHIGMVAKLFGLAPPDPQKCRVLEVGCSVGTNLLPMAESLPNSEFLGIDVSGRQIKEGQTLVRESGLQNIEFQHLNLMQLDESIGKFDYILCHGVYSWVSHDVQAKILALGKRHLNESGIQLVSYNTYPGWGLRGVIREMMLYHVQAVDDPKQKTSQARAFLSFLQDSNKGPLEAYATLIKEEADTIAQHDEAYFFHEHLGTENHPLYFHEFVQRADAAGLRYLADTAVPTMLAQTFAGDAAKILDGVPLVRREQYIDFLCGRMFRSSLLCHPEQQPDYESPAEKLPDLHIRLAHPLRIKQESAGSDGETVWNYLAGQLRTREPMTSTVRQLNNNLLQWTPVVELIESAPDRRRLLEVLMASFVQQVTMLSYHPPQLYSQVDAKPKCSDLARLQARLGQKVISRTHNNLILQPQQRLFVSQMDGTKSHDELAEVLCQAVANGNLRFSTEQAGDPGLDVTLAKRIVETEVKRFRHESLLVE